jgi:outer membrane immunogenic protein
MLGMVRMSPGRKHLLKMLFGGSALAADIPRQPAYTPPPPPPCAQFGGFYVGGNVGWGYGDHQFRDLDGLANQVLDRFGVLLPTEASRSVSGVAYGVQGGYNWQFRCTLFGHRGRLQLDEHRP